MMPKEVIEGIFSAWPVGLAIEKRRRVMHAAKRIRRSNPLQVRPVILIEIGAFFSPMIC